MEKFNINKNYNDFYKSLIEMVEGIRLEYEDYNIVENVMGDSIMFKLQVNGLEETFTIYHNVHSGNKVLKYSCNENIYNSGGFHVDNIVDFYWNEECELILTIGDNRHFKMFGEYLPENGRSMFWFNDVICD